jgi:eukaryotic-like serine/threonine-protein kinase
VRAVSFSTLTEVSLVPLTEPAELGDAEGSTAEGMPALGDLVGGTYLVDEVIGGGAMGVVLKALDQQLGRSVALKVIRPNLLSPGFRVLFQQEARAMALVSHPNVVTIYSFGEHGGVPYFAMELVQGKTLDRFVEETRAPLELELALQLLDQACHGLSAIHEAGTVHRDIKPGNLLVDHQSRLRIGDLGLAAFYGDERTLREVVGTPGYMAPEILRGRGDATPLSDLYSLACVAYELLVGRPPFQAKQGVTLTALHLVEPVPRPTSLRPDLSPAFDEVLLGALAKEPEERTKSVEAFRRELFDAQRRAFEPARILVVEDDPDQREILELTLAAEFKGAEIECVADGAEALAAFERKPATVVISDLQMPDVDGASLTRTLRSRADARRVPIILLTATGGAEQWRRLASIGADRFVLKPVNVGDLVSTIRRAVRERARSPGG